MRRASSAALSLPVVPEHDARPARQDLAVGRDAQLDAGQGPPDGAEPVLGFGVRRRAGRQLGHPPALQEADAEGPEELLDPLAQRRPAADEEAQPAAGQASPDAAEDQPVGQRPREPAGAGTSRADVPPARPAHLRVTAPDHWASG